MSPDVNLRDVRAEQREPAATRTGPMGPWRRSVPLPSCRPVGGAAEEEVRQHRKGLQTLQAQPVSIVMPQRQAAVVCMFRQLFSVCLDLQTSPVRNDQGARPMLCRTCRAFCSRKHLAPEISDARWNPFKTIRSALNL